MDQNDPLEILKSEQKTETSVAESLDTFERRIWPIYEARGYSKDMALLSFSIGCLTSVVDEIIEANDD